MERYKDPNRELKRQYESQKAFIIAKKNMNLQYENRNQELHNIKHTINMIRSDSKTGMDIASQKQSIPNDVNAILSKENAQPISSTSQTSQVSIEKKVKRHTTRWHQVITKWFIKNKNAIINFFFKPAKSDIPLLPSNFVKPHVLNKPSKTMKNSPDCSNNSKYSGLSRVDKIFQVAGVSKTNDNFRDSLVLANIIKEEEKKRETKKSADINSLEFAKRLRQKQYLYDLQNNKIDDHRSDDER